MEEKGSRVGRGAERRGDGRERISSVDNKIRNSNQVEKGAILQPVRPSVARLEPNQYGQHNIVSMLKYSITITARKGSPFQSYPLRVKLLWKELYDVRTTSYRDALGSIQTMVWCSIPRASTSQVANTISSSPYIFALIIPRLCLVSHSRTPLAARKSHAKHRCPHPSRTFCRNATKQKHWRGRLAGAGVAITGVVT